MSSPAATLPPWAYEVTGITAEHIILFVYDIPLLLVHLSVVVLILAVRRKEKFLSTGFYTVFAITSIVDIIHHVEVGGYTWVEVA
ncbi:hypothetical protein AAVH_11239 [Aphelenchoides avenae]|nr:hypothetical protein AAVH_11239 [Aphelenchus avenae]